MAYEFVEGKPNVIVFEDHPKMVDQYKEGFAMYDIAVAGIATTMRDADTLMTRLEADPPPEGLVAIVDSIIETGPKDGEEIAGRLKRLRESGGTLWIIGASATHENPNADVVIPKGQLSETVDAIKRWHEELGR